MNQSWSSSKRISGYDCCRSSLGSGCWVPGTSVWGPPFAWQSVPRQNRPYQVTFLVHRAELKTEREGLGRGHQLIDDDSATKRKRVEAVLLLSKSPITTRKLAQLAHLADATEARTLVRDLNQTYDKLGRAIRMEAVAGGYRMLTRPALAPWLAKLGYLRPPIRLSSPMLETLAVVAYRQAVSRADIEAVRGVACGELLRQLMERDLVRIAGRSEELGRPYLYGTTKRFLQLFGLPSVTALPPIRWQILQDEPTLDDSTPDDSDSTHVDFPKSTKEPVVITSVAPVLPEAGSTLTLADHEISPIANVVDRDLYLHTQHVSTQPGAAQDAGVHSVIEDEEDDLYGDSDDDEEIDDMDDDDDDWDDDEEADDEEEEVEEIDEEIEEDVEEDVEEEIVDDDVVEDSEWEEVDDDDDDDSEDDDDEEWDDEDDDDWDDEDEEEDEEEDED